MNQTSQTTASDSTNPWNQRSELPKPARGSEIFATILFFLASAALSFSTVHENVAIVAWGALIALGYFFTRHTRGLTGFLIVLSLLGAILPGLVLPLKMSYYPAGGAIVSAVCVGCCAGAYCLTVSRRYWLLPLLSLAVGVAAFAVTHSWIVAAMALGLLPAIILLSVSTLRDEGCTTTVCYGIGGLLISVVALLAAWIWITYGSLSPNTLRGLLAAWKEAFVQAQIASRGELIALIEERMTAADATAETVETLESLKTSFMELMSDDMIRQSMDVVFQILPAVLMLCCSIPMFLAQRLLNAAYSTNGLSAVVTPESEFFTMSLPSAVLYAASLFLSALSADGIGFLSMVAENLCLILLPGMLLLGLRYFKQRFGGNRTRVRWLTVTLIVLLCCVIPGALYLGAFFGAYMRIMQAIQRAMKKKMDQNR